MPLQSVVLAHDSGTNRARYFFNATLRLPQAFPEEQPVIQAHFSDPRIDHKPIVLHIDMTGNPKLTSGIPMELYARIVSARLQYDLVTFCNTARPSAGDGERASIAPPGHGSAYTDQVRVQLPNLWWSRRAVGTPAAASGRAAHEDEEML